MTVEPLTIDGFQVLFPFKPYDIQVEYMKSVIQCLQQKSNGLLESPTGTGKTLCILCATLGWLDKKRMDTFRRVAAAKTGTEMNGKQLTASATKTLNGWEMREELPQILYSSRTHLQLSQACKELKRSTYRTFRAVVIGSRDQLCINPEVTKLDTISAKNQTCRFKANHNQCQYYRQYETKVEKSVEYGTGVVFDIEDLLQLGRANTCCPYYAARHIQKSASLVFMPYNYILDPQVRRANKLELRNRVVVFDEGHNIERMCEESVSTQLRSDSFAVCIKVMGNLLEKLRDMDAGHYDGADAKELAALDVPLLAKLHMFICDLEMSIDSMIKSKPTPKNTHQTAEIFRIIDRAGLEVTTMPKLMGTLEEIMQIIAGSPEVNSPQGMAFAAAFTSMKDFLEKLIPIGNTTLEAYDSHKLDFIKKFKIFSEKGVDTDDDKTSFWNKKSSPDAWILHVWCLSPSVGAKALAAEGIHSMIITSGTLAPIHSFEAEMDMKFPVKLQNNHIIGANQLAIINISQSRDKVVLTSKYDNRDNMDYYRALGQTLIDILKTIPKGVLVFFSSYTALNKCTQIWKQYRNDNIWDKLNAVKQLFLEPRAKHAFNECFLKYKQKVDETQSNGAVFFGVFRGKLSEGIDLPDDYCRGVIMTGLPFPAVMDPRVILKKEYLNEAKIPLTADGWYALQMKRALNQAIGRVVRHKDDYGVIILLDSRFASLSDGLSKWVVKYIYRANVNNLDVNLTKLKSFFTNRINSHVVQTTPAETVAAKAFNSQFKPFSQQKKVAKSSPKMNSAINRFTQKNTILDAFKGASSPSVSTFNPTKPKSIFDSMSIIMNKTINGAPKPVANSSSNGSTTTIIEEITLDEESPRKKRLKFNVALKSIADPTLEDNCSPKPVSRQLSNESNSLAKKTSLNGNTTSVVDLEPIRVDPDEDAEEIICISSSSSSSCVANSVITASKTSTISSRDDNEIKCLSDTSNSTANIKTQSSASVQDFWRKNGAEFKRLFVGTKNFEDLCQAIRLYKTYKKLSDLCDSFNKVFNFVEKSKRDKYIQDLSIIVPKSDRQLFLSKCCINSENEFKMFKRTENSGSTAAPDAMLYILCLF